MAHPNYIAEQDTLDLLARLSDAIKDAGHTLRGLERLTDELGLTDVESIKHGNLSLVLRKATGRDLSVQTLLSICKLISINPIAILKNQESAIAGDIMTTLPIRDRYEWFQDGLARLEAANGPSRRLELLRQAVHDSAARASTTARKPRTRRDGP